MLVFPCPKCQKKLKVSTEHAGKKAKCPECATSINVPSAGGAGASTEVQSKPRKRNSDNVGTRQDHIDKATTYWTARQLKSAKEPYLLYNFSSRKAARSALLELPCVFPGETDDQLVCTEPIMFGYYQNEGGEYEAIIAGWALTTELFEKAKSSFKKHGGRPQGTGELAPPGEGRPELPGAKKSFLSRLFGGGAKTTSTAGHAKFVRKESKRTPLGQKSTYEIYKAPNRAAALEFLKGKDVTQPMYYVVVETPEGNWGKDKDGIYQE